MIWGYIAVFIITTIVSVALAPKPPKPKPSLLSDFDFPVAEEGRPVPVIFGTMRVTGANVLWYGDLGTKPIKKSSMFSSQTIGYQYYMGVHFGLSHGGLDALTKIEIGDKEAWTGSVTANGSFDINQPKLFGGNKREGGIVGTVDVMLGGSSQAANGYLTAKIGTPMPAFRGLTTFVFRNTTGGALLTGKSGGYIGTTTYPKAWAFTGRRILTGWDGGTAWYSAKAAIGTSMNPAHILYQCLTDPEWGMGQPAASLDDTAWMAAADQFYSEGFGLDLLWNQPSLIEDFVVAVLDHVGGMLRFNHSTDKLELKLVRADYVHGDLELFDEDDIRSVKRYQRQAWGETVNEITLVYTDGTTRKSTSLTVHDLGNIRSQGERISEVVQYPGVTSATIAARCAARELAARSTPLSLCTLEMTRAFWNYTKGDVFRLNWSPLGIDDVVFRVISVKGGTLQDSIIEVECIEDIFGLPTASYVATTAPGSAPTDATFDPLDDVTGASVASATTTAPPGSPADGAKYLVPTGATGAWSGHVGELAIWDAEDAAWIFETVSSGTVVTAVDTGSQVQSVGIGSPAVPYTPIQTTGKVAFTTDITPTTLAANTNDYAPTGLSTASVLRLSASAAVNLTGLTGGENGRILLIHNVGSFAITLKDENAGSAAANRFALSADVPLAADASTMLQWDSTSSRWRVIGGSHVAASGSPAIVFIEGEEIYEERIFLGPVGPTGPTGATGGSGGGGGGNVTPDTHPGTADAMNDEFEDVTFDTAKWTWRNQGSSTATVAGGSLILQGQIAAGENIRIVEQTPPGGSWTFRAKISPNVQANYNAGGLAVVASGTGKIIYLVCQWDGSAVYRVVKYSNVTTAVAIAYGAAQPFHAAWKPNYYEIEYDGTNLYFRMSSDGIYWLTLFSEAAATFLGTPTRIGIAVNPNHASVAAPLVCDWFRRIA